MIEKVNPMHPDKIADRIAGAIVDYAYREDDRPKIAVEVLIGHGNCNIIAESSVDIPQSVADEIVARCSGRNDIDTFLNLVPQDPILASNQAGMIACGDNGIFKGVPYSGSELEYLTNFVWRLFDMNATDGKFIYDEYDSSLTICQSNAGRYSDGPLCDFAKEEMDVKDVRINPLGFWTGGVYVDSGATNRKLGSDMGEAVTGGGLHGKDLSKADVSVNIVCFLLATATGSAVTSKCSIGDVYVTFYIGEKGEIDITYDDVVSMARKYVAACGGFEELAAWGLFDAWARKGFQLADYLDGIDKDTAVKLESLISGDNNED